MIAIISSITDSQFSQIYKNSIQSLKAYSQRSFYVYPNHASCNMLISKILMQTKKKNV